MNVLQHIRRLLSWVENTLCFAAAISLALMIVHILADATLRTLGIVNSLQAIVVVAAWYMVAVVFLAVPYTSRTVGQISVNLVTQHMSSRLSSASSIFVRLLTAFYVLMLCYLNFEKAIQSTHQGEVWETAKGYIMVWPSRWLVPLAFGLMGVGYLLRLGSSSDTLPHNDPVDE